MNELWEAAKEVDQAPKNVKPLRRESFDLSNGVANSKTRIARYEAEVPLVLTERAMKLALTVVDEFTTDGTAGSTETFNLTADAIQTLNTNDFLLFENGARVQPDSVDFDANTVTYTDDGTGNTLHAYYVPRDATQLSIDVQAPRSHGGVVHTVYDDATSILHDRNQAREPPRMNFDNPEAVRDKGKKAARALDRVVPRKWFLDVYQNGPVAFEWDDSDTATPQGSTATNALLSVPVAKVNSQMPGLSTQVRKAITER